MESLVSYIRAMLKSAVNEFKSLNELRKLPASKTRIGSINVNSAHSAMYFFGELAIYVG